MSKFKPGARLLVLNDEAHHCYLPQSNNRSNKRSKYARPQHEERAQSEEENKRAAVWYSGLVEI
ncbi:MAG: hypothetical protein ACE5I1_32610, partial [bacterium]